jgi:hypothetical protein
MSVAIDDTSTAYALGRTTPGPLLLGVAGVLAIIAWRRHRRVEAGLAAWEPASGRGSGAATRLWAAAGVSALLGAALTLCPRFSDWLVGTTTISSTLDRSGLARRLLDWIGSSHRWPRRRRWTLSGRGCGLLVLTIPSS